MQYTFGEWTLDTQRVELSCAGRVRRLRRKAFQVLAYLLVHPDRVVPKQELCEQVWPQQFISDAALEGTIKAVRQALGDSGRGQRLIQTVYGQGYRFIVPVSAITPTAATPALIAPSPPPSPAVLVERAAVLAHLEAHLARARQGTRQVVLVTGEPGIGKTAVVEAFMAQAAAEGDCWVAHGQCSEPYGPGEPYRPVLEAVGRLCRDPEGNSLIAVLRQYAPSWLAQMPALLPPAEWEALQRTVGHAVQPRMLRELAEALDALTAERPLVLVLEDLHWSDSATLAWVAAVARRPDPARLMVLGTYRPGDTMVQNPLLQAILVELRQHGQCVELALEYLSEAAVMAYLCQRFGGSRWAADLARVLHQRTSGNPLFVVAVADELVRQQVVTEGPSGWDMQRGGETIPAIIPAHLQALIAYQLAHCSPEDQALLATASVAGVEFAAVAVAAGLEQADEVVEAWCAALAQQGRFLQAHGRVEWPDGTVSAGYRFIHAVYQEVVYQRLSVGRQSRWHARIGLRLAHGFGEDAGDMAATVAQHCVQSRLWPQAVQYVWQAGRQAVQRGAHQEAVAFYEQALHALQQLPTTPDRLAQAVDLHLALDEALFPLGAFDRVCDTLREAERLAEALGDTRRLGWVSEALSVSCRRLGAYDQAVALAQRAMALAATAGDGALHAWSALRMGQAAYFLGDYPRASACFREALATTPQQTEDAGAPLGLPAHARSWLIYCLAERGEFGEGLALGTQAVRLAETGAFPTSQCAAYASLGYLSLVQGEFQAAIAYLERGLELCRRWHNLDWLPECATSLGLAYALEGCPGEGLSLLEQAVTQETTMGGGHSAIPLMALSQGYLLAGRLEEARAQAERALDLARERQERGSQAWVLRLLGDIAAQSCPRQVEDAAAVFQQALALAEALAMRPLQAHCHQGLGTLYATTGQRQRARAELATAVEFYRALEMPFWRSRADAALAQAEAR